MPLGAAQLFTFDLVLPCRSTEAPPVCRTDANEVSSTMGMKPGDVVAPIGEFLSLTTWPDFQIHQHSYRMTHSHKIMGLLNDILPYPFLRMG